MQALIASDMGEQIKAGFAAAGRSRIQACDLPDGVDLRLWRQVARRIAYELGRPFHSGLDHERGCGWAALADYPATDAEQAAHLKVLHQAVEAAGPP